ncbi:uncharacterized protein [Palaemon carinicauda]|uniref:uncharacterized protein n=1 Tax=Palaemon carinicauda TaxID=392227 RepID=UPI0035B61F1D
MATLWEGENLLVKLGGILRFCCESGALSSSIAPSYSNSVLPQGYHRGQAVDEPNAVTDPDPWGQLLVNHRLDGPRYTIIPTISVVPPWDDPHNDTNNLAGDQSFGESVRQIHYINPTPVLDDHSNVPSDVRSVNAVFNATQRFYDALRVVLHGGSPPEVPSFRYEQDDSGGAINADVAGLAPQVLHSFEPQVTTTGEQQEIVMSPILQVCAALGILVVIMVILFHSHHFRQDCVTERRALRRVARRYHVAKVQDDVERNEEVTDVTL